MLSQIGAALEAADMSALAPLLAPDVVLRVAVHDRPFEGADAALGILGMVIGGPLHDISIAERLTAASDDGGAEVGILTFTASVPGYPERADGLLVVRSAGEGRIGELTVFLRPLGALGAMAAEVGKRLGGPPPQAG